MRNYLIVLAIVFWGCSWALTIALYHANTEIRREYKKLEHYCANPPLTMGNTIRTEKFKKIMVRINYRIDSMTIVSKSRKPVYSICQLNRQIEKDLKIYMSIEKQLEQAQELINSIK